MYSEWLSLTETVKQKRLSDNVLRSFPPEVGREVVASVIRPLKELVLGKTYISNPLATPDQVKWTMQVVGYGLTLPLSDLELLKGCTDVYRDWLSALTFQKKSVPSPIAEKPDHYAQVIFDQLCALFVPRVEFRLLEDHALICNKVIDTIHGLIQYLKMSRETWTSLFSFLLHICDLLLSPPSKTPSLGTSLCDNLIHVLFATWLKACQESFPSPTLWKTLQEFCANWRHHRSLVKQWCQLMVSLTRRVTIVLYGPKHLKEIGALVNEDHDFRDHLTGMSPDAVVQCWFRMLHTLRNPMDLLYQELIVDTQGFKQALAESEAAAPGSSSDLRQSTINLLPIIFHDLMKGVTTQVFLFLGKKRERKRSSLSTGPLLTRASPSVRRREGTRQQVTTSPHPHPRFTTQDSSSVYMNVTDFKAHSSSSAVEYNLSSSDGIVGKPKGKHDNGMYSSQ